MKQKEKNRMGVVLFFFFCNVLCEVVYVSGFPYNISYPVSVLVSVGKREIL